MSVQFDWLHGEEDQRGFPESRRQPRRRSYLAALVVVIVAGVLAMAAWFVWSRAEKGLWDARTDVQAVVDTEAQALRLGDEAVFLSMQDYGDRQWYRRQELFLDASERDDGAGGILIDPGIRVTDIDLRDDMAWTEVKYLLDGVRYRRIQFYRLVSGHWRRTSSPRQLSGASHWRQRASVLGSHTTKAEEETALQLHGLLEDLCQQMIADFAVGELDRPLTFELQPVTQGGSAIYAEGRIVVPSPMLLGVRADGEVDLELLSSLSQSMALLLAVKRSGLYMGEVGPGSSWVMLNGVLAWEVGESLGRPALPEKWYDWLMDAHVSEELPSVSSLWPPYDFGTDRQSGTALAQVESVVDYMADFEDKNGVPYLLNALGRVLSAAETVDVVWGSTLEELERGWRLDLNPTRYQG